MSTCNYINPWKPCSGCNSTGYDENDYVTICVGGIQYIAKSLVDGNQDEPMSGSMGSPKTWDVRSLPSLLDTIGKDCSGGDLKRGDTIASCADLAAIQGNVQDILGAFQTQIDNDLSGVVKTSDLSTDFTISSGGGISVTAKPLSVDLSWDSVNERWISTVRKDSTDYTGAFSPANGGARVCGDQVLVVDADTNELVKKFALPNPQTKYSNNSFSFGQVEGAAVDALVGTVIATISVESLDFENHTDCYDDQVQLEARLGAWKVNVGNADDTWELQFLSTGDTWELGGQPTLRFNSTIAGHSHSWSPVFFTETKRYLGGTAAMSYNILFDPPTYTAHAQNLLASGTLRARMTRTQITVGA